MSEFKMLGNTRYSAVLIIIVLSVSVLYFMTFRDDHNWGGDFAQYIAQAESISEGTLDEMMRISTFRYVNSDDAIQLSPKLYPWGYSVLLAPVYRFFGIDMVAMKLFTSLFFLLSLPVIYLTFKDRIHGGFGLLLVAVIAFNPFMFSFKEEIRSDFPFLFFTLLSVYLIKRFVIRRDFLVNQVMSQILLGIAMFMSFSIRGNGILLLPCLFLAQVMESRTLWAASDKNYLKMTIFLIPYLAFFSLVKVMNFILPGGESSYAEMINYLSIQGVRANAVYYSRLLSRFFYTPVQESGMFLYLAVLPFFFIGLARRLRRDYLYAAFIVLTLGLFIIYPGRQGLRYILPVIPFFLYFAFTGLDTVQSKLPRTMGLHRMGTWAVAVILVLFMHGTGAHIYAQYMGNRSLDGPYSAESMEMFKYIRNNTSRDSIIIFFKPRVMTLYTGRLSARTTDFGKAIRCGADYAVIKRTSTLSLVLKGHETEVEELFSNGEFAVYSLDPERKP